VITFEGVPSPSIAVRQWPTVEEGAYALRIVLHETPEGIASSLVMEPEGNRFHQQRLARRLRMNQWAFTPAECPAMGALYAEFPAVVEPPAPDVLPPCYRPPGAISELRVATSGKVEVMATPMKYSTWLGRVWSEIDACRRNRTPVTL
jgi:hypothetical protein